MHSTFWRQTGLETKEFVFDKDVDIFKQTQFYGYMYVLLRTCGGREGLNYKNERVLGSQHYSQG